MTQPGVTTPSEVRYVSLRPGRLRIIDAEAPPERLAMFRILTGVFALGYFLIRFPVFLELGDRDSGFDPVGLVWFLDSPLPASAVDALLAVTLLAGGAYLVGWHFRISGPLFALGVIVLGSYRGSWGQLLHFENLMALHLLVVALAPAADAWALDARRSTRRPTTERPKPPTSYGWPLALAALIVVITYVIAGLAKLRYGGLDWVVGDTLRNHVAYSAARLDLLGGTRSPLAGWAVQQSSMWQVAAAATIVIELGAPVALLGGRIRTAWVIAAWSMHAGILAFMLIGFPYPLFLVAFAPFYRIERLWTDRPAWLRRGGAVASASQPVA